MLNSLSPNLSVPFDTEVTVPLVSSSLVIVDVDCPGSHHPGLVAHLAALLPVVVVADHRDGVTWLQVDTPQISPSSGIHDYREKYQALELNGLSIT